MKVEFTFDKAKVQQRGYTLEAVYHTVSILNRNTCQMGQLRHAY